MMESDHFLSLWCLKSLWCGINETACQIPYLAETLSWCVQRTELKVNQKLCVCELNEVFFNVTVLEELHEVLSPLKHRVRKWNVPPWWGCSQELSLEYFPLSCVIFLETQRWQDVQYLISWLYEPESGCWLYWSTPVSPIFLFLFYLCHYFTHILLATSAVWKK